MRTISYRLEDLKKVTIHIGYVAENEHTRVQIDAGDVFEEYPEAVATMKVQPPRGSVYPATVSQDGNIVTWDVKDSDLVSRGAGEIQLTFTQGTVVVKSCIARINIDRSIVGSGTAPNPVQDWIDDANEKLEAVETAIQEAEDAADEIDDMTVAASGSAYGTEPTATITEVEGHKHVAFTIPAGEPGTPGDPTQLIDDTAGQGTTGKTWSADKLNDQFGGVLNDIHGVEENLTDEKANVAQIANNGYQKYFPEWERGGYTESGKATDNNRVRSKNVIYLPVGTYTIYSAVSVRVYTFTTAEATSGVPVLWDQTGEKTFNVTSRNYIGITIGWSASTEEMPTGIYIIVPSAVSDVIAQAEKNRIEVSRVSTEVVYSDGIYTAVLDGVTEYENKSVGTGLIVGSVVSLNNDEYQNAMEVPVVAGKTYRVKARVFNNYYSIFFCNNSNVLISQTGQNTTGSAITIVDFTAVAPSGATKMYIQSSKSTKILVDVFEPYTVKQMIEIKDRKAIGALCVMEFNVGDWYEGIWRTEDNSGAIPADETIYTNYMSLFNNIFSRYKPDIVMINEDAQEMCLNRHSDSRAFFGKYFLNMTRARMQAQIHTDVFNTIASAFPVFDVSTHYYTVTESNTTRNWLKGYTYINGKKICLICTHLSPNYETGKLNATELLTAIQAEDPEYLICCGDFNLMPTVAEVEAFETAGYVVSNGSVTYDGHEYGPGDFIITTSNITVKSVFCDTQKIDASFVEYIDHLPTVAYLEIF